MPGCLGRRRSFSASVSGMFTKIISLLTPRSMRIRKYLGIIVYAARRAAFQLGLPAGSTGGEMKALVAATAVLAIGLTAGLAYVRVQAAVTRALATAAWVDLAPLAEPRQELA